MGDLVPLRLNLLRGGTVVTRAGWKERRRDALELLAKTDERLALALSEVMAQELVVSDARAAVVLAERDDRAGWDGMYLVRKRSAEAIAHRELLRLEEALRQCRWEAFHARMRRLRAIPGTPEPAKPKQLALFDLVTRGRDSVPTGYWAEVRAA